jgi:chorismate dehydratase
MPYRVAAVSFLNTLPLIEWFSVSGCDRVVLSRALPSRLASLLCEGEADVALLPVVEVFRGNSGGMIPGTGIACRGNVDSVKLFCKGSPGKLTRIRADRGSRTSVALLGIILKESFRSNPEFVVEEPLPGHLPEPGEGVLVIGDRCFEYENALAQNGETGIEGHDLGAMWMELTGLPFVFAIWAVAPGFVEKVGPGGLDEISELLTQARDFGLENLESLALREAEAGRIGHEGKATGAAIDYYFRYSLQYQLGDPEMEGIRKFHEFCIKHGVVPPGDSPLVLEGS